MAQVRWACLWMLVSGVTVLSAEADASWRAIVPGGETVCSNGGEYRFFVREGNPDKLLVHFQGGGGCWRRSNCDLQKQPTYDPAVDGRDHPGERSGIFDLGNEDNPVSDFTMVFVTYCTADVHLGDRKTTYSGVEGDAPLSIQHRGAVNGRAALSWTFDHVEAPRLIVVTGSSAGAIGAPFHAGLLADHYRESRIVVVADGAGGYRTHAVPGMLANWGAIEVARQRRQYRNVDAETMDFETYIEIEGRSRPDMTFAQYNTSADHAQIMFLGLIGAGDTPLIDLLDANHAEIRNAVPGFRSYLEESRTHTILSRPEFYSSEVNGVKFVEWFRRLVEGEAVKDVRCDC